MRTAGRVALGSAAFAAATGLAYWVVAREPAGTALLAAFAAAFVFAWAYIRLHHPGRADAPEDRPDATPGETAGEHVGTFAPESAWPIILAAGSMLVAAGVAYGVWLLAVGAILAAIGLIGLARE